MSVDIAFSNAVLPISGVVNSRDLNNIKDVESSFLVGRDMSIAIDASDHYDQWKVYLSFEEVFVLHMWRPSKGDMRTLQMQEEVSVYMEGVQVTINDTSCTYRATFESESEAAAVFEFFMKCRPNADDVLPGSTCIELYNTRLETSRSMSPEDEKLYQRMEMHKQTSLRKMSMVSKRPPKASMMQNLFNNDNQEEEEDMTYRSTL